MNLYVHKYSVVIEVLERNTYHIMAIFDNAIKIQFQLTNGSIQLFSDLLKGLFLHLAKLQHLTFVFYYFDPTQTHTPNVHYDCFY